MGKIPNKVLLFLIGSLLMFSLMNCGDEKVKQNYLKANPKLIEFLNYNKIIDSLSNKEDKNRLIFLFSIDDFNCPLCFDDFMKINEMLQIVLNENETQNVFLLLITNEEELFKYSSERIKLWKEANDIKFTTITCVDSIFTEFNYEKPSSLIINSKNEIIFKEKIPMGEEKHRLLLKYLRR